jgi:hypothetical protein
VYPYNFPACLPWQNLPLVNFGSLNRQPLVACLAFVNGVSGTQPLFARIAAVMLFRRHNLVGKNTFHFNFRVRQKT